MEITSRINSTAFSKEAVRIGSKAAAVTLATLAVSNQKRIVELTFQNRLPAMFTSEEAVANGAFLSYGPDRTEALMRVAAIVENSERRKAG